MPGCARRRIPRWNGRGKSSILMQCHRRNSHRRIRWRWPRWHWRSVHHPGTHTVGLNESLGIPAFYWHRRWWSWVSEVWRKRRGQAVYWLLQGLRHRGGQAPWLRGCARRWAWARRRREVSASMEVCHQRAWGRGTCWKRRKRFGVQGGELRLIRGLVRLLIGFLIWLRVALLVRHVVAVALAGVVVCNAVVHLLLILRRRSVQVVRHF